MTGTILIFGLMLLVATIVVLLDWLGQRSNRRKAPRT